MALIRQKIENILNGVSQKAATVRPSAQHTIQENMLSHRKFGLRKRPGTTHVAKLVNEPPDPGAVWAAYLNTHNEFKDIEKTQHAVLGDHVRVWGDSSGNGRDSITRHDGDIAAGFTLIPQIQDSGNGIRFGDPAFTNGAFIGPTTDQAAFTTPGLAGFTSAEIWITFKRFGIPLSDVRGAPLFGGAGEEHGVSYFYKASDGRMSSSFGTNRNYDLGQAPSHHFTDRYHTIRIVSTPTHWRFYLDGVLEFEDTTTVSPDFGHSGSQVWLGESVLAQPYNGYMKHVLICNGELTAHQADRWLAYFSGLEDQPPMVITGDTDVLIPDTVELDKYNSAFIHEVRQDATHQYFVVVVDGQIQVFDRFTGEAAAVTYPDGQGYLTTTRGFKAISIGGTTYLLNLDTIVATTPDVASSQLKEALIVVRSADYSTTYTVTIDGTPTSVTTVDNTSPTDRSSIDTGVLANAIATALFGVYTGIFAISRFGSSVYLKRLDGADFTLAVSDGLSDAGLQAVKESVQTFADLPPRAPDGMILKVAGDTTTRKDDYWVRYDSTAELGQIGVWKECAAPGVATTLDAATMPWMLAPSDVGFAFQKAAWAEREAGDDTTCPMPSFVGQRCNEIFFTENRLGLTAGKSIVASRPGALTNFMRTTATDLLATDPIDITSTFPNAAPFESATEWNGALMLCTSAGYQFALSGDPVLTPQTARMDHLSSFPMGTLRPVTMGKYLCFARAKTAFSEILQYFLLPNGKADARVLTEDVPQYLSGSPRAIVGDSVQEFIAVRTSGATGALWVFSYHYDNDEANPYVASHLSMSGWSKWTFPNATVIAASMLDNVLSLLMLRSDGVFLETIDLGTLELNGVENNQDRLTFRAPEPFQSRWQLSPLFIRNRDTDAAETQGRLQLRYLTFNYHDTTDFTITVTPSGGRAVNVAVFHSDTPATGAYTIPLLTRNTSVTVEVTDATTGGFAFDSVDWLGEFTDLARRV